ncbi:hypothetical protein [uncultured Microbacterium sp.]|uniref:hypothetical protein n=1 Tax=uncultured Microbacterium sp. TaxID=191216 RepID=UPI0025E1A51A|nr:hypothetical protein [uncultured Microbacterium sp.]
MTAPRLLPTAGTASVHEHAWVTESSHITSEGRLRYVRCTTCPARRVDVTSPAWLPPSAASRVCGGGDIRSTGAAPNGDAR